jgi:hypothetical protein
MARSRANYQFEDDQDTGSEIELSSEDTGTLKADDLDDDKKTTLEDATDAELFDDLPNSPFKSEPKKGERAPEGDDVDEDDEDEDLDADEDDRAEDDPEDEPEERDEEDEDEDLQSAPKSWRKRLLRQERLLTELRDETRALSERNRSLEKATKARESDTEFETRKTGFQTKIEAARAALAKGHEEGANGVEIARLTEELADAKGDLRAAQMLHEQTKKANEEAAPVDRQPRLAKQWMRKHTRFQTDPEFNALAITVDRQIKAAGFDPETEEYYRELDKRFPEEYRTSGRRSEREDRDEPRRRKAPTQDMSRNTGGARNQRKASPDGFTRRGNTIIVSARQKANMRKFGLDPDNKNDLKGYVRDNLSKAKR